MMCIATDYLLCSSAPFLSSHISFPSLSIAMHAHTHAESQASDAPISPPYPLLLLPEMTASHRCKARKTDKVQATRSKRRAATSAGRPPNKR